jgi:hypothetical protein
LAGQLPALYAVNAGQTKALGHRLRNRYSA